MDRSKKLIIIFNATYALFSIAYANEDRVFHFSRITSFIILIIPIFLYWSGVWIFGFGYIFSFLKKHKRFFRNIFLLSILFCLIFKIASGYKLPTDLEKKQGCFILHNSDSSTCLNGKEYDNYLISKIINKGFFMVHTEDCSTGYVSKKLSNFPFPFSINSREYKEAVLLGEYLEKNGFKEEADVIYLKETKKVPTRWLCSESDYFGRTCYCRIADSK